MNKYILPALFCLLGIFAVIYTVVTYEEPLKYMEYNGVQITGQQYQAAKEANKDNIGFVITDIETGNRVQFTNINNLKQLLENGR